MAYAVTEHPDRLIETERLVVVLHTEQFARAALPGFRRVVDLPSDGSVTDETWRGPGYPRRPS